MHQPKFQTGLTESTLEQFVSSRDILITLIYNQLVCIEYFFMTVWPILFQKKALLSRRHSNLYTTPGSCFSEFNVCVYVILNIKKLVTASKFPPQIMYLVQEGQTCQTFGQFNILSVPDDQCVQTVVQMQHINA